MIALMMALPSASRPISRTKERSILRASIGNSRTIAIEE
jgi:hypothetical protein